MLPGECAAVYPDRHFRWTPATHLSLCLSSTENGLHNWSVSPSSLNKVATTRCRRFAKKKNDLLRLQDEHKTNLFFFFFVFLQLLPIVFWTITIPYNFLATYATDKVTIEKPVRFSTYPVALRKCTRATKANRTKWHSTLAILVQWLSN